MPAASPVDGDVKPRTSNLTKAEDYSIPITRLLHRKDRASNQDPVKTQRDLLNKVFG